MFILTTNRWTWFDATLVYRFNECNQRRLSKRYDHLRSKALLRNRRDFAAQISKQIDQSLQSTQRLQKASYSEEILVQKL